MTDFKPGDKVKRRPECFGPGGAGFDGQVLTVREVNPSSGQLRFEGIDNAFAGSAYYSVEPATSSVEQLQEEANQAWFELLEYREGQGLNDMPMDDKVKRTVAATRALKIALEPKPSYLLRFKSERVFGRLLTAAELKTTGGWHEVVSAYPFDGTRFGDAIDGKALRILLDIQTPWDHASCDNGHHTGPDVECQ